MRNVALIGFGHAGRYLHAPFIKSAGFRIKCIVTSRRHEVAELLPDVDVVPTIEDALTDRSVNVVVVASPSGLHFAHAKKAIGAGKATVVEKPFSQSEEEARELIRLAAENGVLLTCYHNRRWDSDFRTVKRVLAEGKVGRLHSYTARWDRFRPLVRGRWREDGSSGSGVLHDLAPHLIDQAIDLFGPPQWVEATLLTQRNNAKVNDGFEIRMGTQRLSNITLAASSLVMNPPFRYHLNGDQGTLTKSGLDVQEEHVRAGLLPNDWGFGIEPEQTHAVLTTVESPTCSIPCEPGTWISFYTNLLQCIEAGDAPAIRPEAAALVMRVIDSAVSSSVSQRRLYL